MCSMNEDMIDESYLKNSLNIAEKYNATCRKCSAEQASVVLQKKFSYCKSCFLQLVNHKFRATIGKLKLKQLKDRILVVFSGSQSSTALLHLLQSGMNENNHKKLRFHVDVLVIDDSILWPNDVDPQWMMSEVLVILRQFSFNRYTVKLSDVFKKPEVREFEKFVPSDEYDSQLERLFTEVKSSTSKIDLLFQLRSRLAYECAALLNCNKIFTSECATDIAVRLLSNTTLGRSSHITYDSAICDTRNPAIHCIRPLRELTSKEISFYNVFNGLDSFVLPSSSAMFNYNPSLQWETLMFISNLQEEFPSTVYTVFNVGDKLKKTDGTGKFICALCGIPFEARNSICDSENEFLVSDDTVSQELPVDVIVGEKLKAPFCCGCEQIVDDMANTDNLPVAAT